MDDFIQGIDRLSIGDNADRITQIHYRPETYHVGLFEHYSVSKPELLANWIPQRQAQFLAGRLAARASFGALDDTTKQVLVGAHREPIWPECYTGSISHSEHTSIAAVIEKRTPQTGLGVDIQSLIDSDTQSKIATTILSNHEIVLLQQESQLNQSLLFTLIFSAKESFFKAVFPQEGRYFDFDAVSFVGVDAGVQRLRFEVTATLNNQIYKGLEFDVAFLIKNSEKQDVFTYCNWNPSTCEFRYTK